MPCAEQSLEQKLIKDGAIGDIEAVSILHEIALGLLEVKDLVHRDLKPGNILYFDSAWRVADFGIARFIEESTSARTLKECLSPPFAAPEQWRLERTTNATDVYALGCIGYALLTGNQPFSGPAREDYQDQ
ncbi:MAG: protein kinase, partial [Methylococcaceae bacterium]